MNKKNGYGLQKYWLHWACDHRGLYSSIHVAMFHTLCAMNNRAGWREQFTIKTLELMAETGITSRTTFIKIIGDLVKWHFVTIVSPAKNQYEDYLITLSQPKNDDACPLNEQPKNDDACPLNEQAHPLNEQARPLNEQPNTGNDELTGVSECLKLYKTILNNICVDHDENSTPKNDDVVSNNHEKNTVAENENPSIKPKKIKKHEVAPTKPIQMPWPSDVFADAWDTWKKYKREQWRFIYKPIGENAALKFLFNEFGGNERMAIDAIERAVAKGWKGVHSELIKPMNYTEIFTSFKTNQNGQQPRKRGVIFDNEYDAR